jgi:hypothetical protein
MTYALPKPTRVTTTEQFFSADGRVSGRIVSIRHASGRKLYRAYIEDADNANQSPDIWQYSQVLYWMRGIWDMYCARQPRQETLPLDGF